MKNKFREIRNLLMAGALGILMVFAIQEDIGAERKIDGKCTLTIDANKNYSRETAAYGTGKCYNSISGRYHPEAKNYEMVGSLTTEVYDGQVELIRVVPFDTYEITVHLIPPKGESLPPKNQARPEVKPEPKPEPKPDPVPPVMEQGQVFTDVPKSHWAYKEVNDMQSTGLISGYGDGTFKPNNSISRMHVAMIFARTAELLQMDAIRPGIEFKDVPKGHSAYDAIQKVYRAGIFDGKGNGEFGVNDNLTRAQMAKVLVDAFDLEMGNYDNAFGDVPENHWATEYIKALYESGITVGDGKGNFNPSGMVTRAQFTAFLHRALTQAGMIFPE